MADYVGNMNLRSNNGFSMEELFSVKPIGANVEIKLKVSETKINKYVVKKEKLIESLDNFLSSIPDSVKEEDIDGDVILRND